EDDESKLPETEDRKSSEEFCKEALCKSEQSVCRRDSSPLPEGRESKGCRRGSSPLLKGMDIPEEFMSASEESIDCNAWSSTWLSSWFRTWNIEYLLPSVNIPGLVIQGKEDQYGTAAQVNSIKSKSSGKTRTLMLDGCGHSPHQDSPELLVRVMSEFIFLHL
ncbi:MAG: alpha/beta hydrolase, partial [Desulfamplus sp.]|nr:alpha/beta hydrolase [Desulfamplus sp.]